MFLNNADKIRIFQENVYSLNDYGENRVNKRPSTFAISSAVRKCKKKKKLNECDVFMLTLLTDKEWFMCERMLYDVIK